MRQQREKESKTEREEKNNFYWNDIQFEINYGEMKSFYPGTNCNFYYII